MFQRLRNRLRDYMDSHVARAARTSEILERLETLTRLQAYTIDRLNEEAGHVRQTLAASRGARPAAADNDAANKGAAQAGMAHDRV